MLVFRKLEKIINNEYENINLYNWLKIKHIPIPHSGVFEKKNWIIQILFLSSAPMTDSIHHILQTPLISVNEYLTYDIIPAYIRHITNQYKNLRMNPLDKCHLNRKHSITPE